MPTSSLSTSAGSRPAALTVVAVGSLPAAAMVEQVAARLRRLVGQRRARALDVADAAPPPARQVERIAMPDKAQADVAYGFIGVRRLDPRYMAASVMNNALGQYALGGRLGDSIRERQGMAYYVFSSLDGGLGPGPLMVRAGVSAENVERTIASIDSRARRPSCRRASPSRRSPSPSSTWWARCRDSSRPTRESPGSC